MESGGEFDRTSAASIRQLLTDQRDEDCCAFNLLMAAGLPIAAAGLTYACYPCYSFLDRYGKSSAAIWACQTRVDAGADPAPIGIALSRLLTAELLDRVDVGGGLREWYVPELGGLLPKLGADMCAAARPEAAAAVARGIGSVQPAAGDTLAWIVYCCDDLDSSDARTRSLGRIQIGLERGDLGPEVALAAVLSLTTFFGSLSNSPHDTDLQQVSEAIAAGFARECNRGPGRLSLPPVIV